MGLAPTALIFLVMPDTARFGLFALMNVRFLLFLMLCAVPASARSLVLVSIPQQKLVLYRDNRRVAQFPVSTSKFGVGDRPGSYFTPLGELEIARKIGARAPLGAVFHGRRMTGEIVPPNSRGRDPIVSRILWLRGLESRNRLAFERGIYIHGTAAEADVGRKASYGCVRMRSRDVVELFDSVEIGARVRVVNTGI